MYYCLSLREPHFLRKQNVGCWCPLDCLYTTTDWMIFVVAVSTHTGNYILSLTSQDFISSVTLLVEATINVIRVRSKQRCWFLQCYCLPTLNKKLALCNHLHNASFFDTIHYTRQLSTSPGQLVCDYRWTGPVRYLPVRDGEC